MESTQFDLGPNYENHLNAEVKKMICDNLRNAYDNACGDHEPANGADGAVFGSMVWRYNSKETKTKFKGHEIVKVIEKNNRLRVYVGDYKVGFAKVGTNGREDIENLFPGNMNNVFELANSQDSQLTFFEHAGLEAEKVNLRSLMIIHQGNTQDGLCTVHACFPVFKDAEKEDKIVRWAYIEKIYDINDHDSDETFISNESNEKAPIEKVQPPVLKLKDDSQQASK